VYSDCQVPLYSFAFGVVPTALSKPDGVLRIVGDVLLAVGEVLLLVGVPIFTGVNDAMDVTGVCPEPTSFADPRRFTELILRLSLNFASELAFFARSFSWNLGDAVGNVVTPRSESRNSLGSTQLVLLSTALLLSSRRAAAAAFAPRIRATEFANPGGAPANDTGCCFVTSRIVDPVKETTARRAGARPFEESRFPRGSHGFLTPDTINSLRRNVVLSAFSLRVISDAFPLSVPDDVSVTLAALFPVTTAEPRPAALGFVFKYPGKRLIFGAKVHSKSSFASIASRDVRGVVRGNNRSPVTEENAYAPSPSCRPSYRLVSSSPSSSSSSKRACIARIATPGENTRPDDLPGVKPMRFEDRGARPMDGAKVHSAASNASRLSRAASTFASATALRCAKRSAISVLCGFRNGVAGFSGVTFPFLGVVRVGC